MPANVSNETAPQLTADLTDIAPGVERLVRQALGEAHASTAYSLEAMSALVVSLFHVCSGLC